MSQASKNLVQQLTNWDWTTVAQALSERPARAREIFARFGISVDTLLPLCAAPEKSEPYGRRVLFRSGEYEVMLATWAKGAECAAHDHGASSGLVWLAMGQFIENHYAFAEGLQQIDSCLHSEASAIVSVHSPDIHSMRAPQGGISLHVYNPPIHQMKVYDSKNRRTLTVSDDCGAWVPVDQSLIVDVKTWPKPLDANI